MPGADLEAFLDVEYERGRWARVTAVPDGTGHLDLAARGEDGKPVDLPEPVAFSCRVRFTAFIDKEICRNARVHRNR